MKRLLPVLMGFVFLLFSSTKGWSLPHCEGSPTVPATTTMSWTDCFGTMTYSTGGKYVGEWKDGLRHGQGTRIYASGGKYVGEWKDGKRNGQGTYTRAKGDKYVGGWKGGWKHGQGTVTFADGTEQEGIFENGKFLYAKKPSPTVIAKKTPTPKPKPVQKVAKRPDDVAVIIANSNYTKLGKDIPNVTPAYNDAENIKKYFIESLGIREGNIIYLKDATGAQLTEVFGNEKNHKAQLFNWVRPNKSNVHIYYAGHGAPASKDGSAYLVPSDAKSQKIEFSGYLLTNLYRNLNKIRARSVTVILEACFSGFSQGGAVLPKSSGIMVVAKEPTVPSNVRVISAGAADQMASWEEDGSQSLFTKYFLKGMSGEGDKKPYGNGDGKVEDTELKKYLDDTMTYYARRYYGRDQTAQIVVNGKELSPTN
jgi:hypothetical protein